MRSKEITFRYLGIIDRHIEDIVDGSALEMYRLSDIASLLFISQQHLSETIRSETGYSPSHFYSLKIMTKAMAMIEDNKLSIAEIAFTLTYDPSNFTKAFKRVTGMTPAYYKKQMRSIIHSGNVKEISYE